MMNNNNNNNTRNNCINVDETVAVAAGANAETTSTSTSTSTSTTAVAAAAAAATTAAAVPEFVQLNETRRCIYRVIAAIHDESFNKLMNRLLRQFECAIREGFESAQNSPLLCRKLARNIIALTDQIHTLQQRYGLDSSSDSSILYRQRMCFIVAIYIACELCAAQDRGEKDRCILERISSMLTLYVEDGDVGSGAHKENTLLTLVAIPKVFGQANIITVLYSRLFPQWSTAFSLFSQIELPDKIYIEYIIIFYCWQRLERDEATRQRIIEFASKFMRPSSTLPFNSIYVNYLPDYGASRTATRTILEHLNVQQSCTGLRAASRIDNRLQAQSNDVIFDSDEEKAAAESGLVLVSTMAAAITLTITPLPPPAPDPPDFLKALCENARRLEPVKRATALYRGIDSTCEVVDLCESDDDVEMFSLDFSVPANVDGNEASATVEDDYLPITRIFPSNLRTYQRATSSAANIAVTATTTETYTMPRIVNSYSCRRDSLHLVSTTQTPPHLVDQCVQTAEQEGDPQEQQQHQQQQRQDQQQEQEEQSFEDDAISTCMLYPTERLSVRTEMISAMNMGNNHNQNHNHNHHCHQSSSRNSNSSEASLQKKQVTFNSEHLGASSSSHSRKSHKIPRLIKPSIKRYKNLSNTTRMSLTPTSSMDHIETLKWMGRKEHLQAGQRMFSKLEARKYCDKRTSGESLPSGGSCRKRKKVPTTQLTPTTSNASSGAPTPQPKRLQSRGPQRSLPTPPASTHSSSGIDIDFNQLQGESGSYRFNRRKFGDISTEHIRLCNHILQLQRIKMQEKRKESKEPLRPQLKPIQKKCPNPMQQKLKRLRNKNVKLHQTVKKLESDINLITNYAKEEKTMEEPRDSKELVITNLTDLPVPVVRLKRLCVDDLILAQLDVLENPVESVENVECVENMESVENVESVENTECVKSVESAVIAQEQPELRQPAKGFWNKRRRRKGHRWCRMKNGQKKKQEAAAAAAAAAIISDIPSEPIQSEPDQSVDASEMLSEEPSATATATTVSVPLASPAIITSTTVSDPASTTASVASSVATVHSPASDTAQSIDAAPASVNVPVIAAIPPDPHVQNEQDHGIAAYVTLSANGECCDEQDAVVKQITESPTPITSPTPSPSPEAEQSTVMVAHEIEVATSHVPVYLLNGESRDVTTPVPAIVASEDVAIATES